jgi:hypothetical protein
MNFITWFGSHQPIVVKRFRATDDTESRLGPLLWLNEIKKSTSVTVNSSPSVESKLEITVLRCTNKKLNELRVLFFFREDSGSIQAPKLDGKDENAPAPNELAGRATVAGVIFVDRVVYVETARY